MLCIDDHEEAAKLHGHLKSNVGRGVNIELKKC